MLDTQEKIKRKKLIFKEIEKIKSKAILSKTNFVIIEEDNFKNNSKLLEVVIRYYITNKNHHAKKIIYYLPFNDIKKIIYELYW